MRKCRFIIFYDFVLRALTELTQKRNFAFQIRECFVFLLRGMINCTTETVVFNFQIFIVAPPKITP